MAQAWPELSNPTDGVPLLPVLAMAVAILLLGGLWTPIAGVAVAVLELVHGVTRPGDPWSHILLGTLGVALALLGPGAWSIDARLFGWKRIDVRDRSPRKGRD